MYYLNSRYYNPEIGRFINEDELLESGHGVLGNNLYTYCSNNPVMGRDPTGTFSFWDLLDIGGFVDSVVQMVKKPSLGNAGWLALDVVGLLPLVPGAGTIKAGSKIVSRADKVKDTVKVTNKTTKVVKVSDKISGTIKPIDKITGYTKHGINAAISKNGFGVKPSSILDAVKHPIRIMPGSNGATRYIGEQAIVNLNDTGKVITTWATSSKYWRK